MHGGRSAYNNLLCLAQSNGIPESRVAEVLDTVGLTAVARKKTRASRSAWASGWESRPRCSAIREILMFDEPVNGLDPEGIHWIRNLMKSLAARGPDDLRLLAI